MTKKKVGRPKGVKNGQGKKKFVKKASNKSSKKTAQRKTAYKPKEREEIRKLLVQHYGDSRVQGALLGCSKMSDLDAALRQLKMRMEEEIEAAQREVEEYYEQIDMEYKRVGRPKSIFNEKELRYLCSIHCTREEIAGFFQMNKDVLSRKVRKEFDMSWNEFYESNSQGSKVAIRRKQIQVAMDGDTQMLKFLGKNMLGQKDKLDFDGEVKVNSWVDLVNSIQEPGKEDEKESETN